MACGIHTLADQDENNQPQPPHSAPAALGASSKLESAQHHGRKGFLRRWPVKQVDKS